MTGEYGYWRRSALVAGLVTTVPAAAQPAPEATGQQEPSTVRVEEPRGVQAAGQDRALMISVGTSTAWDSNVFKVPDGQSDRIGTISVGLHLDQPYAQQRLLLDVTETAYRYDHFSHLDFDALQYRGAWVWQLGPRVSGTLGADRSESLVSYADFRDTVQNVRTAETRHVSADAWLFGGWHLLGGVRYLQTRYSVPFPQEGDQTGTGVEAGVRSQLRSGSALTVSVRSFDVSYDRALDPAALLDDGYRRAETEALASWVVSAKTTAHGRVSRVEHRSNHFDARNFTDTEARIGTVWAAAAKLAVQITVSRDVQPWSDSTASYRVNRQVRLVPSWQVAPRTTLQLNATRAQSDYRGAPPGFATAQRSDLLRTLQLAADWRPLRNLTLNAGLQRQRQASTDAASAFSAKLATLGGSLAF